MAAEELEPGDMDDDLPPLVGDSDEEPEDMQETTPPVPALAAPPAAPPAAAAHAGGSSASSASAKKGKAKAEDIDEGPAADSATAGICEAEALLATEALRREAAAVAAAHREAEAEAAGGDGPISAASALRGLLAETEVGRPKDPMQLDEKTIRMIKAISKDDFEECEDAIMQGADVNADCGAGMRALHISALRGEMFLTELLIAHGADVNERDLSGNTPLLYACHFYRQHQKGVSMVAQLLFHKADPFYRVRDGKLAGKTAHDLMDKACNEPNMDENVPRQMRAMLQLAMEDRDDARDAITKMWMHYKSQNKKLYQVSSKKDSYNYAMKNIDWEMPENAKNAQAYTPVQLEAAAASILGEKFTELKDYLFSDEGDKVKVYVTFPERAAAALGEKSALEVRFEMEALEVRLLGPAESFRLRMNPLFGTIEVSECKHRVSAGSSKVTLTLAKRHKNRIWPSIQKPR